MRGRINSVFEGVPALPGGTSVSRGAANYSHFNLFKEVDVGCDEGASTSSLHRQARVDTLPAVRSAADIAMRLSDTADPAYPIYRNMTLHTLILDGDTADLHVWCCGRSATSGAPAYRWNMLDFWGS